MKLLRIFSALFFVASAVSQDFLFSDEILDQKNILSRASVFRSQPSRISELSNFRGRLEALNKIFGLITIFSRMPRVQAADGRSQHFWKLFSFR